MEKLESIWDDFYENCVKKEWIQKHILYTKIVRT